MASLRANHTLASRFRARAILDANHQKITVSRRNFHVATSYFEQTGNDPSITNKSFRPGQTSRKQRERQRIEDRCGRLSPFASQIQIKLRAGHADPFTTLQQCIERGEANSEVVRVCLVEAKARMLQLPRSARVAEAEPKQFARKVMVHIFSDPALWVPIAVNDHEACTSLCWFAVAEGLSDKILLWLQVKVNTTQFLPALIAGQPGLWRNSLLRSLVEAIIMHELNHDASEAIQALLKAMACKKKHEEQNRGGLRRQLDETILGLSAWPSVAALVSFLTSGSAYNTDPALYDAVVEFRKRYGTTKATDAEYSLAIALLAAWHPTTPTAKPAVKLLHDLVANDGGIIRKDVISGSTVRDGVAQTESIGRLMSRAHDLLENDHVKVAAWIAKIYEEAFSVPIPPSVAPYEKSRLDKDGQKALDSDKSHASPHVKRPSR